MKNKLVNIYSIAFIFAVVVFCIAAVQTVHYLSPSTDGFSNRTGSLNNLVSPLLALASLLFAIYTYRKQNSDGKRSESQWTFDTYFGLFNQLEGKFEAIQVDFVIMLGEMKIEPHYGRKAFKLILTKDASYLEKNYEALTDLKIVVDELVILLNRIKKKDFEEKELINKKILSFYDVNLKGLWKALEEKYNNHITPTSFPPLKESLMELDSIIDNIQE